MNEGLFRNHIAIFGVEALLRDVFRCVDTEKFASTSFRVSSRPPYFNTPGERAARQISAASLLLRRVWYRYWVTYLHHV